MASNSNKSNVNEMVLGGILRLSTKSVWTGTMTELRTSLNRVLTRSQRNKLPGSPGALRMVVNKVANRLRNRGIGVRFGRTTDHARTRFVKFVN